MQFKRENRNNISQRNVVLRSSCFGSDGKQHSVQTQLTYEELLYSIMPWEKVIEAGYQLVEGRLRIQLRNIGT